MAYSNLKKIFFIIFCLFVVLFPFFLVTPVLADSDIVDYDIVPGLYAGSNQNYFVSNSNAYVGAVTIESGYIYHISKITGTNAVAIVSSSQYPAVNVTYDVLTTINAGESYDFLATSNTVLYVCFNTTSNGSSFTVTREKIGGMSSTVDELASIVSPSALWNIFDISINYIVIVVCVAFGIFIIFKLIRKLSKGKEGL